MSMNRYLRGGNTDHHHNSDNSDNHDNGGWAVLLVFALYAIILYPRRFIRGLAYVICCLPYYLRQQCRCRRPRHSSTGPDDPPPKARVSRNPIRLV